MSKSLRIKIKIFSLEQKHANTSSSEIQSKEICIISVIVPFPLNLASPMHIHYLSVTDQLISLHSSLTFHSPARFFRVTYVPIVCHLPGPSSLYLFPPTSCYPNRGGTSDYTIAITHSVQDSGDSKRLRSREDEMYA